MKNLFCEDNCNTNFCVRRVMGCIGFLAFTACILINTDPHPLLDMLGMLSASLIGLTTVDKFIKSSN